MYIYIYILYICPYVYTHGIVVHKKLCFRASLRTPTVPISPHTHTHPTYLRRIRKIQSYDTHTYPPPTRTHTYT